MARLIPNESTWVGFLPTMTNYQAPSAAAFTSAIDLTPLLISLNASAQGNAIPTPNISSLFETTTPGTVQASFTADFYRDDEAAKDLAYTTLPRRASGFILVSRWSANAAGTKPIVGDKIDVWPITVISRTNSNLGSNTVMTFTVTCSVTSTPAEDVVVLV